MWSRHYYTLIQNQFFHINKAVIRDYLTVWEIRKEKKKKTTTKKNTLIIWKGVARVIMILKVVNDLMLQYIRQCCISTCTHTTSVMVCGNPRKAFYVCTPFQTCPAEKEDRVGIPRSCGHIASNKLQKNSREMWNKCARDGHVKKYTQKTLLADMRVWLLSHFHSPQVHTKLLTDWRVCYCNFFYSMYTINSPIKYICNAGGEK